MSPVLLAFAAFGSTLGGGALALRFRHRLHHLLGFTAGVLLGVVAFDLLPEMFGLAHDHELEARAAMVALVAGFLVFHALEKFVLVHPVHETHYAHHHHPHVGAVSALVLAGHSVMDGVAIGIAFQVSTAVGLTVTLAVVAHDFSDGLNTVSLMLRHGNPVGRAVAMLLVDAVAPVLGAASTMASSPGSCCTSPCRTSCPRRIRAPRRARRRG
jgi:ZIP family zinc transporter